MFARLAASAVRMGRLRVAGVAAGVGAAAFGTAMSTAPAQAAPSIPDMLASISAKVEALEAKMEAGDGGGTGFGSFSMAGKSVVVTGGASGIGYGMCELFAKRGATVFLLDLFPDKTEEAAAALGPKVTGIPCNVADAAAVTAAFEAIKATGNRVDVMINNAGIAAVGNVEKATEAEMDRVFAVNVKGVFHCAQESCKMMTADGKGGVIINLASIASVVGIKDRFAYGMTKGAVLTMTYSIATDYMHKGIRCNAIAPTRVHTPFVDGFIKKNYPGKEAEVFEKLSKFTPLGRMAEPKEIAAAVYFLCTPEAAMIQGECLNVDGGVVTCMDAQEM